MSKKAFKVLIVEDDTALLKVLTVAIEKAGYDVVACTNPAEALSRVRHIDFNMVLLDCVLPKMNGVDLAQSIRKFLPTAHFIFMSGILNDKTFIAETLEATESRHFLTKPLDLHNLIRIIDDYARSSASFRPESWFDFWQKSKPETLLKRLTETKSVNGQDLPTIVSLILQNNLDGCLKIKIPEIEVQAFFRKGHIVKLNSTDQFSFFGALLINNGLLSAEELDEHIKTTTIRPLGESLVKAQLLSPHAIEQTLKQQTLLRLSRVVTSLPTVIEWQTSALEKSEEKGTPLSDLTEYIFNWCQSKIKVGWLRNQYVIWLDECPIIVGKNNVTVPEFAMPVLKKCDGYLSLGEILQAFKNADHALTAFHALMLVQKINWGSRKTRGSELEQIRNRLENLEQTFQHADHFSVLGVPQTAKAKEVKRAFLDLSKSLHPDQLPPDAPEDLKSLSSRVYTYVTNAHETLGDIANRESYLKKLRFNELKDKESGQNSMYQAIDCLEKKSYRQAYEIFSQLKQKSWQPQYLDLYCIWADVKRRPQLTLEDGKKFEQQMNDLAPEDRHSYLFYFVKGLIALSRGLTEEARSCFQNSSVLNPQFKQAAFELQTLGGSKNKSNPLFNSSSSKKKSA